MVLAIPRWQMMQVMGNGVIVLHSIRVDILLDVSTWGFLTGNLHLCLANNGVHHLGRHNRPFFGFVVFSDTPEFHLSTKHVVAELVIFLQKACYLIDCNLPLREVFNH